MARNAESNYPSDWNSRRRQVYQRDGYVCQNCGARGGPKGEAELHAHHVVPVSNGGSHEVPNLTTVCKDCHDAIHGDVQAPTGAKEERARLRSIPFSECPICKKSRGIKKHKRFPKIRCINCGTELQKEESSQNPKWFVLNAEDPDLQGYKLPEKTWLEITGPVDWTTLEKLETEYNRAQAAFQLGFYWLAIVMTISLLATSWVLFIGGSLVGFAIIWMSLYFLSDYLNPYFPKLLQDRRNL